MLQMLKEEVVGVLEVEPTSWCAFIDTSVVDTKYWHSEDERPSFYSYKWICQKSVTVSYFPKPNVPRQKYGCPEINVVITLMKYAIKRKECPI